MEMITEGAVLWVGDLFSCFVCESAEWRCVWKLTEVVFFGCSAWFECFIFVLFKYKRIAGGRHHEAGYLLIRVRFPEYVSGWHSCCLT
jgi:hypothetical protein